MQSGLGPPRIDGRMAPNSRRAGPGATPSLRRQGARGLIAVAEPVALGVWTGAPDVIGLGHIVDLAETDGESVPR
eukprot:10310755-Alexandrium_andersonii.AAC.1